MKGQMALSFVQKSFPKVRKVIDARRSLRITVLSEDNAKARKKDPESCALARACVRQKVADGAIIGLTTSYLIRGNRAIRYHTSQGVSREITSFDRHQNFEAGEDYLLSKVSPGNRLTARRSGKSGPHTSTKVDGFRHHTTNVRILRKKG